MDWGGSIAAIKQSLASNMQDVTNEQRIQACWRIDFSKLYSLLSGNNKSSVKYAKLWGSEPPNDPFWDTVKKAGFKAEHWPRNSQNKEKGIDTAIALEMGMDSGSINKSADEIIVVSADEDIIRAAESLRQKGFKVTIYAWKDNVARSLKDNGLVFTDLTPYFNQISL